MDEQLHAVLRTRRHELKRQWDERAVGDEAVRKEYWQELKETLAREEMLVRVQNSRLADSQLMEALRSWQEWLDNEDHSALASVSTICEQFGCLMERMPAVPLSRAGRTAIQAAVKRVAAARSAASEATQRLSENQKK